MSPAIALSNGEHGHVRFIPLSYDHASSRDSALKLLLTLVPQWTVDEPYIEFARFTDGITNILLKAENRRPGLSQADIDDEAILLRAYGNGSDVLIDREREAANHELLMKYGLAPQLLARFANGMLYRFVPGEVAQPRDLAKPEILAAVARHLAQWHAIVPYLSMRGEEVSNGSTAVSGDQAKIANAAPGKHFPNVWTTMQKWILALPTETPPLRERRDLLQRELDDMIRSLSQRAGLGHNGVRDVIGLLPPTCCPGPWLTRQVASFRPLRPAQRQCHHSSGLRRCDDRQLYRLRIRHAVARRL